MEIKDNKEGHSNNSNLKMLVLIVFSFVMGGIIMVGILKWTPLLKDALGTSSTSTVLKSSSGTTVYEKSSLATSVAKVYEAVVMVSGYKSNTAYSTGSGFVYKSDDKYGYLLTNEHVISGCDKVKITFSNDKVVEAKVLGSDSYLDLAVLQVDKSYITEVATIGSSEKMNLGDTIFTIGTPMGEDYRGSVTSGILSGKDRMVSVNVSNTSSSDWVMRVLQIDASINPGNSGGPLLNVNGEVIGICSMKLVNDSIEGMGFAIPIEYAMSHISSLEKGEKIVWPVLGISMANVTDTSTLYMNGISIDKNITSGVVVVKVVENTGAAKSDLKSGDVITKIDNNSVKDSAYLRYQLYQHKAGDTITITYIRGSSEHTTKVTLSKSSK